MSLLALEPGMDLWSELPSKNQQNAEIKFSSGSPTTDMARPAGDLKNALDEVSLESILKEYVPIINGKTIFGVAANLLTARKLGSQIQITWLTASQGKQASFRILNVTGKEVASLLGQGTPKGYSVVWSAPQKSGTYFIQAKAGKYQFSQMIWVNSAK